MKTYEEMAKYVLEVRDEHDKKRKHRIALAKRVIPAAAGVCCAFIIGFGVFKGFNRPDTLPVHDNIIESETTSAQVTTIPQTTKNTSTALTTAVTSTEKSTSKTTVSESKVTTVKNEVTSETSSKQTSSAATSSAEHTTASTSVTASTNAPTTTYTTVTTQETTTTIAVGGGGGLSGDSQHDFPGGMGGGSAGGEGNGGYAGGATGGGAGGDGNGGYAGGGTGGSGSSEEERWSQLTINHRYYYAFIDGYEEVYVNGYMISSDIVGSWIGEAEMESQTFIDGYIKKCSAEVYSINGYSDKEVVAIKFKGHDEYYLYCKINTDIYELMKKIPPHQ